MVCLAINICLIKRNSIYFAFKRTRYNMGLIWSPKINIISLLQCIALFVHILTYTIFFFIIFILIKMPTNIKYDIQTLTFSHQFRIFQASFSHICFYQKSFSDFLNRQNIFINTFSIQDV